MLQWSKEGKDGEEVEMQRSMTKKAYVGEEEGRADKRGKIKLNSAQINER